MVNVPGPHPIQWVAPAPLWEVVTGATSSGQPVPAAPSPAQLGHPLGATPGPRQPALLTIADDDFMTMLQAELEADRIDLRGMLAWALSYRVRPPGYPDDWEPDGVMPPLKLYQATHGHFNLIATSLVCQVPGLPEHMVHPELKEEAAFVVRRTDDSGNEWAWCGTGSANRTWVAIDATAQLEVSVNEQLLPLFPVNYTLAGVPRRLFVGLIPTSSVDTFQTAATTPPVAQAAVASAPGIIPPSPNDLMLMAFGTRVGQALAQLLQAPSAEAALGSPALVLEFASFLNDWFPASWTEIIAGRASTANPALFTTLANENAGVTTVTDAAGATIDGPPIMWLDALTTAWKQADVLSGEPSQATPLTLDLSKTTEKDPVSDLTRAITGAALEDPRFATSIPGAVTATAPKLVARIGDKYRLRCVYRRPQCLLERDVVSDPTESFQLATYFDYDAPARPVTISLPQVNKLSDLRKFRRNVNVVISKQLHAQMDRIIDLKSTLNGTLNQPEPDNGLNIKWICSFSISIVFIVALFLLLMFVIVLNLIFWWLPFFEICLPVPE